MNAHSILACSEKLSEQFRNFQNINSRSVSTRMMCPLLPGQRKALLKQSTPKFQHRALHSLHGIFYLKKKIIKTIFSIWHNKPMFTTQTVIFSPRFSYYCFLFRFFFNS